MITELKSQFDVLNSSLKDLSQHLHDERPNHFFPLSDTEQQIHSDSTGWMTDLLTDLWYRNPDQDGRETRSRHGIVLATEETLRLVHRVNENKQTFATVARQIKADSQRTWKEASVQLRSSSSSFRDLAGNSGMSRVHLRQCTRMIPVIEDKPKSCRFTWYNNGRSITRLTVEEAHRMLLNLGEEKQHIQVQLQTLAQLPANTPLARIQTLAPSVRANLVFRDSRKAMNCPLPLFVAADSAKEPLPSYKDVPLQPPEGRTRKNREDNRISDTPLLPSIRVYTYER